MLNNRLWAATNMASLEVVKWLGVLSPCSLSGIQWICQMNHGRDCVQSTMNNLSGIGLMEPKCDSLPSPISGLRQGIFTYSLAVCSRALLWSIWTRIWIPHQGLVFKRALSVWIRGWGHDSCAFQGYLHLESFPPLQLQFRVNSDDIYLTSGSDQGSRNISGNHCALSIFNKLIHYF